MLFTGREDARMFLGCLARVVRDGWMELHAYCLLRSDVHLLVRGSGGLFATALRSACSRYESWSERRHPGGAARFRGRFQLNTIRDVEQRRDVLRYIDGWPLFASVAADPDLYPYASAGVLCGGIRRPPWLTTDWIESELGCRAADPQFAASYRASLMGSSLNAARKRVEARLLHRTRGHTLIHHLEQGDLDQVAAWLRNRATPGLENGAVATLCRPEAVEAALGLYFEATRHSRGERQHEILRMVLLRELCGMDWDAIARRMQRERNSLEKGYGQHRWRMAREDDYARMLAQIACSVPRLADNRGFVAAHGELIPWQERNSTPAGPARGPMERSDLNWRVLQSRR